MSHDLSPPRLQARSSDPRDGDGMRDAACDPGAKLVEAKRLALAGQLTAGVAHELNNLLGKIIGLAEMIGDEVADRPDACAELETLISVAEQGAGLVARLGASAGCSIAEPDRFDLATLVVSACAAAELRRPDVERHYEIPGQPCWIRADAALVRVALDALLDNAAQWGSSQIEVRCQILRSAGREDAVEVLVGDDGTGMTPEVLARAAEPFFTTRPAGEGAGLGLSLARSIMTQSGGRVEAESHPGGGALVRLIFPLCL